MRKNEKDENIYSLNSREYAKSNMLIASKYKTHLFEAQLLALALSHIQYDENEVFTQIKASTLKQIFGDDTRSFYKKLSNAAKLMTGRAIGMSDPVTQEFAYHAVITDAVYKNGVLTINFNGRLKEYITNIKTNFTKLSLDILMSFDNVYSFRLYEVLKSKLYLGDKVCINLAELRFLLGVANADDSDARVYLSGKKNPDYEKAIKSIRDKSQKKYMAYHDFEKYVLKVAVDGINEKADFKIAYEAIKGGYGKVVEVMFTVTDKIDSGAFWSVIEASENETKEKIREVIEEELNEDDINALAKAAGYDVKKIEKAYSVAKKIKRINNLVGFLIKAINDNYSLPVDKSVVKEKYDFEQRDYDYEKLEKEILSN